MKRVLVFNASFYWFGAPWGFIFFSSSNGSTHHSPLHSPAHQCRRHSAALQAYVPKAYTYPPPPFPNTHTIPHIPQPLPPLECGVTCGTKGTHTRSPAQKVARVGVMCRVSKQTQDQVRAGATHPSYLRITLRNVSLNPPYMLSRVWA
jgi:hypothetical protein